MISDMMAFYLLNKKLITEDELPIYKYGLSAFVNSFSQIILLFLLGLCYGVISETVSFLLVFILTRRFTGGYHADTKLKCLLLGVFMWFIATSMSKVSLSLNAILILYLVIVIFSVVITFKYAPVEHRNKPLSKSVYLQNKKLGRICTSVCLVIGILMYFIDVSVSRTIMMTIFLVSILILIGRRDCSEEHYR
ncbi:MAG: accessory gene regulator B family protein [Lachnospiraceae bacterium]|nr:accessory gene regulator B family protein [Lachnospiraceae bacterium]